MYIAICDDESVFRTILHNELTDYAVKRGLNFIIFEYADGSELLSANHPFDLIFLDHQMKNKNGIDTISILRARNNNTTVIFVSSYQEIVFESMKYKTFRFLVKPLDKGKLIEALDSVIKERHNIIHIVAKDELNQKMVSIPANEIIYAQADNIYASVITQNFCYKYLHKISQLEEELEDGYFFRTNRSYIVNFNYVLNYNNKEITLINGHRALISKAKYKSFKQVYLTYLKNKSVG